MATLEINGKRIEVDDSFKSLSPEEQARTVDEIAASMEGTKTGGIENNGFMGQVNAGIANTIDFVNPFDNPAWKDVAGGALYTGPAADIFRSAGIATADRPPETVVEGMGRGVGDAAAALPFVIKGLSLLRGAGGAVGNFADDAYRALTTTGGVASEMAAGAISGGAGEVADAAGAPGWVGDTAEVLAPLAVPAAAMAAYKGVTKLPLVSTVGKLRSALTPMTQAGARAVARDELRTRVGGNRAEDVAAMIDPNDPLKATPAQMTGDPELLALERAAGNENPELRARLETRADETRNLASKEITDMGGDFADTRAFFRSRLKTYKERLTAAVDRVMGASDVAAGDVAPANSEVSNSTRLVSQLKSELADAEAENAGLWAAVPLEKVVPVDEARRVFLDFMAKTPAAQQNDIPAVAKRFLAEGGFADAESASELHGLYSELRRISRAAMSGEPGRRNANLARIANGIAEAILVDLGAVDQSTDVGKAISNALAHTRAMHETFDQGAPGRILKRTTSGDEAIPDALALERTVGQGGISGDVDAEKLVGAAPGSRANVTDYLRSQFSETLISPNGEFNRNAALTWMRKNKELMTRYPELRREFFGAIGNREKAEGFAARAELREKMSDNSIAATFSEKPANAAIKTIIEADDPIAAAREVARASAKDQTGATLEGVKAAFSDFLIGKSLGGDGMLNGRKLYALVSDPKFSGALKQLYSPAEVNRIKRIAEYMRAIDAPAGEAGKVIDRPSTALIETVLRIAAAKVGGKVGAGGGMGGSLQTANIFSSRARKMLDALTNENARRLLMDAVEDPILMRELLTEPKGVTLPRRTKSILAPYLTGGAASAASDDNSTEDTPR